MNVWRHLSDPEAVMWAALLLSSAAFIVAAVGVYLLDGLRALRTRRGARMR
jgi:hypothetical protein